MPIPFKNCGKAGDILSVQKWDASSWPPAGASGPLAGTATFDPVTGALTKLRVVLFLGTKWVFETVGDPGATVASGFVTLPSSVPMVLVAPPLPLSAGPLSRTDTFSSTVPPITVLSQANLGQNLTSVTASLNLTYNGMSGFPIPPATGAYEAMLQLLTQQGAGVFCIDVELTDTPFIGIASAAIPTLSEWAQIVMAGLLVVGGFLALRHPARKRDLCLSAACSGVALTRPRGGFPGLRTPCENLTRALRDVLHFSPLDLHLSPSLFPLPAK